MSLKTLYGLQSVLLAAGRPTGDLLLERNRVVEENQERNKKYLKIYGAFTDSPQKLTFQPSKELLLPVNLIIFDKYYRSISEWRYLDRYQYDQNILVFNKKDYESKKIAEEGVYKKYWLNNLIHLKDYDYSGSTGYIPYKYPVKEDSNNINWIEGGGSSHNLRNILHLNLPKKIENSFEMHQKIIELDHSFLMSPVISLYSGYWKNGELNRFNNMISTVEYGNLKSNFVRWSDIYNYISDKPTCSELTNIEDYYLKGSRKETLEGFDSQCDRINLLNFDSVFKRNEHRRIYASGFAGYKIKQPAYWNTHYYFYSLGDWTFDKPTSYRVNRENGEKNLWYVDYDEIFVPEIKLVEHSPKNQFKKKFQLSFYLDYKKIKDIEAFFKISTKLSFSLKFKYKAKEYEKKFLIGDVLSSKKFYFEDEIGFKKADIGSFSNFELIVYSENPNIKLSSSSVSKEFKYSLNLTIIESRFNVLHGLILDQEELNNFYYSELKKKENLYKFFYLINRNSGDSKVKLSSLPNELIKLLNVKIMGVDFSDSATIEYFDFFENQVKKVELSNLLKLPTFHEERYVKRDSTKSIEEIVSQQHSHKIGNYFWSKMRLQLVEKNLFSGLEKYILKPKNPKDSEILDWVDYYRGTEIIVQGESNKYLLKNEKLNLEKNITPSQYEKLFSISQAGNKELGIQVSDFAFEKVFEDNNELEIEASYNNKQSVKKVQLGRQKYDGVFLLGKAKFKWDKNKNISIPKKASEENEKSSRRYNSSLSRSSLLYKNNSLNGESSSTLPIIISSAGAGAGVIAGAGSLILKKFKISLS